ncbi:cytochrome P450 oxidoreductase [Sclerotinia borealis F-4128]|uniref:Cytochrome P450 oxidoreductase n=1 Tax=Sclerotinia borealis (strain F-4128) TaxID=1432307 RepID=W9CEE7_SCLBF|nr:cytochrome P450 oxidoreductase [Sclerotinia borealis F-4128]
MNGILQPQLDGTDLHNIFSTQDVEYHSIYKRAIGGSYTTTALKDVQTNIDRCTTLFLSQLDGFPTQFQPSIVDMSAWLQYYAFVSDSLVEAIFSKQIDFLATGSDVDGIYELDHQAMEYFSVWSQVPEIEAMIAKWKSLTGSLKPNPLYNFVLNLVNTRVKYPNELNDMLNSLLRLHQSSPDKLNLREVIGAVYINIVAAHDDTAIILRTAFYHLSKSLTLPCTKDYATRSL